MERSKNPKQEVPVRKARSKLRSSLSERKKNGDLKGGYLRLRFVFLIDPGSRMLRIQHKHIAFLVWHNESRWVECSNTWSLLEHTHRRLCGG